MEETTASGCPATYVLSPSERQFLDTAPKAINEADWSGRCDLEPGHEGDHAALGQDVGEQQEYWIRWADTEPH